MLPFVLYNGRPAWTAPVEVADLFAPVPGMEEFLKRFRPRLKYFLIDEGRLRESDLDQPGNVTAALFRIERSEDPEEIRQVVGELAEDLAGGENRGLRESVSLWLRQALAPKEETQVPLQYAEGLEDLRTMLRDAKERWWNQVRQEGLAAGLAAGLAQGHTTGLEEGLDKGRREGRRTGRRQGEARIVLKLLQLKFGALDSATRSRVRRAAPEELERWAKRLLTAGSLDQVFS